MSRNKKHLKTTLNPFEIKIAKALYDTAKDAFLEGKKSQRKSDEKNILALKKKFEKEFMIWRNDCFGSDGKECKNCIKSWQKIWDDAIKEKAECEIK